mmetsp:Transcript_38901/g.91623  ORF Transcript_38901/g.91623 Transcript_38901/m.91623 type:complete len:384 (-) Transcript_38901:183-1334(-)
MSKSTKPGSGSQTKSTNRVTLVMVGPTGQGKSTLGNMLAGGGAGFAPFTTSDDFDSETLESAHADFSFDFQELRVIDTIGFLDTRMDANQNMDKFAGFANRAPGGIDAFIFVLKKGRFTEQSVSQLSAFRSVAGDTALRHTIFVFTHCGAESNESLKERCQSSQNEHLKTAMQLCMDVVGVDSLAQDRSEDDRAAVIAAVKDVVKSNNGQKYDNVTLQEARHNREQLQTQINTLSTERREAMQDKLDGLYHGRFTYDQVKKAVEDAIEREERQKKEEEERVSMHALLAAAKSEAQAWKEVARNMMAAQSAQNGGYMGMGACCGPMDAGTYDASEVVYDPSAHSYSHRPNGNGPARQGGGGAAAGGARAGAPGIGSHVDLGVPS